MIPDMKVTLTVTEGPHKGEVFEFRAHDTFLVGRSSEAQFRLPFKDKTLSRVHFMVEVNPPRCRLMDMSSTNGTFVNGRRVTTADLGDGDLIKGGKTVLAVAIEIGEAPATTVLIRRDEGATPEVHGYRLERELGRGGMGVVYLATAEADGAAVALKMIRPAVAGSATAVERFLRETELLRRLDHPHIVRFRDSGRTAEGIYFAMDYVPGVDAAQYLKKRREPMPIGLAVRLACQALDAMAYAHDLGIVHRDIKPPNLLLTRVDGRLKAQVADFGLARLYQESALSGLTLTGQVSGTVGYMPPEQITDFRNVKPAADLYALGATLYTLLTGRKIYDFPEGMNRQLLMILQSDPVPIRTRRDDIPPALAAAIHIALSRDPAARFPNAAAMRAALEPFRKLR
jgi:eukaryotic-like serine/threonine-protein kinase